MSFPHHQEEGKVLGALHSRPACPPPRAAAWHGRQTHTGLPGVAADGKRSCLACHAVAASSTQIPSSSSPSLSAKSSPCFLALAPRDQTRGDRTKRKKTKGNKKQNNNKKERKKEKNTKKKRIQK